MVTSVSLSICLRPLAFLPFITGLLLFCLNSLLEQFLSLRRKSGRYQVQKRRGNQTIWRCVIVREKLVNIDWFFTILQHPWLKLYLTALGEVGGTRCVGVACRRWRCVIVRVKMANRLDLYHSATYLD